MTCGNWYHCHTYGSERSLGERGGPGPERVGHP